MTAPIWNINLIKDFRLENYLFLWKVKVTLAEKQQMEIISLKIKNMNIYFTLKQTNLLRVPLQFKNCHICIKGQFKLRLHFNWLIFVILIE